MAAALHAPVSQAATAVTDRPFERSLMLEQVYQHMEQPLLTDLLKGLQCLDATATALKVAPGTPTFVLWQAKCLIQMEAYEAAVDQLQALRARGGEDDPLARRMLAIAWNGWSYGLYVRGEQVELALELIDNAIAVDPETTFWLSTKAEVLYALGRYAEALPLIERALADHPDHPEMRRDLARIRAALAVAEGPTP